MIGFAMCVCGITVRLEHPPQEWAAGNPAAAAYSAEILA
jgi:hypothetical protein